MDGVDRRALVALICALFVLSLCASASQRGVGAEDPFFNTDNIPKSYISVRYSQPRVNNDYRSSDSYNPRGMGHLYVITKMFMDVILHRQPYPQGFVRYDGRIVVSQDWYSLGFHYGGLALVVFGALLVGAVVPVAGLIFCCCRCAGKCGARSKLYDKRYDTCKRHFLAFILSAVTVLILFGVVCAVVTNEYMEEGAQKLPQTVRVSLTDTQLYLNNTKQEVNSLLVTNFGELNTALNQLLDRSGEIVKNQLGEISKAVVLTNLTGIVSGLKMIRQDLGTIENLTRSLQENALTLEVTLKAVRENLLNRLRACRKENACMEFLAKYNITSLTLESNFTQLPDVTTSLQNVSTLLANDIENEVMKGQQQFDVIRTSIQSSVNRSIPDIKREIAKAGRILKGNADNVTQVLDQLQRVIKEADGNVDVAENYIKDYAHYRYYVGLCVCGVLSTVLLVLGVGLLCGYCGHRPGAIYDDCCDKGTASRFLMLGVWIMLLTTSGLTIVAVGYMVTGSVADRLVCQALYNPSSSYSFGILDQVVDLSSIIHREPPLNLSTLIQECNKNSSVYRVLGLEPNSMSQYTEQFDVSRRVQELADSIQLKGKIEIVTPTAESQLLALASSPLNNIDLTLYTSILTEKITSIDLVQMAMALNQTALKLPPSQLQVKIMLMNEAAYLELHQERQVRVMAKLAHELHNSAALLSDHLKFNHTSLREAVHSLLADLTQAQKTINSEGPHIVRKLAEDFGHEFKTYIDTYLRRVQYEAQDNVGKCWPIARVYNATRIAVCNNILDPYNGFWLSVGWIVILFLPAIFLSVKLSSLYQKSNPYPPYSDYAFDPYIDSIPLANSVGGNKKKRKKTERRPRGNESTTYTAPIPRSDGRPQDRWDSGDPPSYQTTPLSSEYERPPPYYFPGNQPPN